MNNLRYDLPKLRAGGQVSVDDWNRLIDYVARLHNMTSTGDVEILQSASGTHFRPEPDTSIPAIITAYNALTKRYSWTEDVFGTDGKRRTDVPPRSGSNTYQPAYEINSNPDVQLGTHVTLRRTVISSTEGTVYEFKHNCGCGYGVSTTCHATRPDTCPSCVTATLRGHMTGTIYVLNLPLVSSSPNCVYRGTFTSLESTYHYLYNIEFYAGNGDQYTGLNIYLPSPSGQRLGCGCIGCGEWDGGTVNWISRGNCDVFTCSEGSCFDNNGFFQAIGASFDLQNVVGGCSGEYITPGNGPPSNCSSVGNGGGGGNENCYFGWCPPQYSGPCPCCTGTVPYFDSTNGLWACVKPNPLLGIRESNAELVSSWDFVLHNAITSSETPTSTDTLNTTAMVTTVSNVTSTIYTVPLPTTGQQVQVVVDYLAWQTGGSSCSAGFSFGTTKIGSFKNLSGTVTQLGITTTLANYDEAILGCVNPSQTFNISGTNIQIQVTGSTNQNFNHFVRVKTVQVSN